MTDHNTGSSPNYGPFGGPYSKAAPLLQGTPKKDHIFEKKVVLAPRALQGFLGLWGFGFMPSRKNLKPTCL